MRKTSFLWATIILLCVTILGSCKKDDNNSTRDYTALLKNSVWTGEFNYTGKPAQPVSMSFLVGGQVTWYDLKGSTTGTWKLDNNLLTVSFSTGAGFKATIGNDDTFGSIQNLPVNGYTLNSAVLNTLSDPLDNTTWTGTNIAMHFKAGSQLDMELGPTGGTKYVNLPYVREAKTVRFSAVGGTYRWFMVSNTVSGMKGANEFPPDPATYPFELSKK